MSQTPSKKVLIVDDNPGMRQMIRFMLPYFAGEIIECSDSKEALDMYKTYQPSVVLMDLRLKTGDGISTTKTIKQSFPTAKIVMLSSYGDLYFRNAARQAGASAYVLKDNLAEVANVLKQHGL